MGKRKVLLYASQDYGFIDLIRENLIYNGYDLSILDLGVPKFKYKNLFQRLHNFFRKTFLNDREFKKKLVREFNKKNINVQKTKHDQYDVALVIRADYLEVEVLKYLRSKSDNLVSYHYDGIDRYPTIFRRIEYFDKFFVFDRKDILKYSSYNLLPATNFYFDMPEEEPENNNQNTYSIYYLGGFNEDRINEIFDLQNFLNQHHISNKFEIIFYPHNKHFISADFKRAFICLTETIHYREYLKRIVPAEVLADFVISDHSGLSFRVFESIKFDKKLITTNETIMSYDFYNPNNIFILKNNYTALLDFLKQPYEPLPPTVKNKYSFSNWFRYISNEEPYIPIEVY